jgi:hypothetical protein
MKRFILLTCVLVIGSSAWSMKGPGINHNCIHVISMDADLFYFKSDKEITGATIDVYDYKTGNKVLSQVVTEKRTIVDLYSQQAGDYIILITKGDFKRKYVYHKTTAAPAASLQHTR